LDSYLFGV